MTPYHAAAAAAAHSAGGSSAAAAAASASTGGAQGQESQAGAINAELFARKPEQVQLLLNLLEDEPVGINDFYVRYHTVQLLTLLLQVCAYKLQAAILAAPMGVVRLCELLGEREVIRNEALQLLVALTRANEEVQKIAAFEGAFDRVFNIVTEEGGAEGQVVVQDCLELLNNLLRSNQANQRLFREMGFIGPLVRLLAAAVPPAATATGPEADAAGSSSSLPGAAAAAFSAAAAAASAAVAGGLQLQGGRGGVHISRQKAAILLCALEAIMLLVSPGSSSAPPASNGSTGDAAASASQGSNLASTNSMGGGNAEAAAKAACHAALLQAGVVDALLPLCLQQGGVSSTAVRVQALRALGDVISGHPPSRDKLAGSTVLAPSPPGPTAPSSPPSSLSAIQQPQARSAAPGPVVFAPVPALQALLRVALHGADPQERAAADHVLRAFCTDNPDGQLALVCSITTPATSAASSSSNGSMGAPSPNSSFGSELAAALVGGSQGGTAALQVTCRAALLLQHLLASNPTAKQRLLNLPLELPATPTTPPELLLPKCMKHVMSALRMGGREGQAAATLLLRLLVVWVHACGPAAKALLDVASHLPLLVDLVLGRHLESCTEVSGVAALLLGECLIYSTSTSQPQPAQGSSHAASSHAAHPPSALVLDVLLTRVGLSQYLSCLDDLMACPAFVAASQPAKLPKPVTRSSAAAATAGEGEEEGGQHAGPGPVKAPGDAPHASSSSGEAAQLFDFPFTQLAREVVEAVKQAAMAAFAKPGSAGGASTPALGSVEQVVASLPGASEAAKLLAAADALRRLETEVAELRNRNRVLAEDLFKVAAGGAPSAASQQQLAGGPGAGPHHSLSQPSLAGGGAGGHAAGMPAAPSAAELEARMAAELRANKAEMELSALKQQFEVLAVRLQQADKDAVAAREAAAQAHLAATKHETDLQDLSAAYNSLEAHAFQLESQVRELSAKAATTQAPAAASGVPEAQVQARIQAAVAAALEAERKVAAAGGGGMVPEAEAARQVEEARAEAAAEADEQMTDLLVCLGQEEQKVALLREKLAAYGVDVDALLATIQPDEPEGEEQQQDDELQ